MSTGQEQHIILLGIDAFVWDGMPECLVLFEFVISSNRIGLCAQLPKNDTGQQTRIGLTCLPCLGAERDLHARFNKMFPGDSNLCSIEVPIRKWDNHLFCHSVLSSNCPFTRALLLAGTWQNHKTGYYSYGICSPFVTYLLALLTHFEIFSIFQVSDQARSGSIHEISHLAQIAQASTTHLTLSLSINCEGVILVRTHLDMKLIYADKLGLVLLGLAFVSQSRGRLY